MIDLVPCFKPILLCLPQYTGEIYCFCERRPSVRPSVRLSVRLSSFSLSARNLQNYWLDFDETL